MSFFIHLFKRQLVDNYIQSPNDTNLDLLFTNMLETNEISVWFYAKNELDSNSLITYYAALQCSSGKSNIDFQKTCVLIDSAICNLIDVRCKTKGDTLFIDYIDLHCSIDLTQSVIKLLKKYVSIAIKNNNYYRPKNINDVYEEIYKCYESDKLDTSNMSENLKSHLTRKSKLRLNLID